MPHSHRKIKRSAPRFPSSYLPEDPEQLRLKLSDTQLQLEMMVQSAEMMRRLIVRIREKMESIKNKNRGG